MTISFREFFKERHGFEFPGRPGETWDAVMKRYIEAHADYADYLAAQILNNAVHPAYVVNVDDEGRITTKALTHDELYRDKTEAAADNQAGVHGLLSDANRGSAGTA